MPLNLRLWPIAANLAVLAEVSFRRQSRRDLLAASITARDPNVWSGRAVQETLVRAG
jgi:hypothetical protein